MNVLQLNIIAKKTQFIELLNTCSESGYTVDVLLLCETFMNNINKNSCKIKNYNLIAYEYRTTSKQGGVAIYLRKGLKSLNRKDLNIFKEGEFESCFVEIITEQNKKNIIIGEIYRIPGKPEKKFLKDYENLLKLIGKENKATIIGTDQNIDYLKINTNNYANNLFELNLDNNLIPTITRPTRITHTSATLIDNINISINLAKNYKSGIITTDISDHFPCLTLISNSGKVKQSPYELITRRLNKKKIENIKTTLVNYNWDILNETNANDAYNKFEEILTQTIDKFAPETIKKVKY
jgi:exonuclease III